LELGLPPADLVVAEFLDLFTADEDSLLVFKACAGAVLT